jgi:hypothetical protein
LAPSNSDRVSFALAGIFPYAVDGKIKGVVIVIAGSAIASPSTAPTGSSPAGVFVESGDTARQSIAADTKTFTWMDNTVETGKDIPRETIRVCSAGAQIRSIRLPLIDAHACA